MHDPQDAAPVPEEVDPPLAQVDRSQLPPVGPIDDLDFPEVTRTRLSNGIEVVYANRDADSIIFRDELDRLQRHYSGRPSPFTSSHEEIRVTIASSSVDSNGVTSSSEAGDATVSPAGGRRWLTIDPRAGRFPRSGNPVMM